jgi:hypothetical protein
MLLCNYSIGDYMKIESELKVNPIQPVHKETKEQEDEKFKQQQFAKARKFLEDEKLGKRIDVYA